MGDSRPPRAQAVRWKIARRHLNRRRSHRLRWALAIVFTLFLLVMGGSGAAAYYFVAHLPSADAFHISYAFQNARIYDSRGDLLFDMADLSKWSGRRIVEPLQPLHDTRSACQNGVNRIPLDLQNATIATEDATFYKNPGFDVLSIIRAALQNLQTGHVVSGASTITQQVVRAAHLVSDAQTLNRKAEEVALAYEISKKFSKSVILWYYLNSVSYGNEAVGAQAAAQVYFRRPVCTLDVAQAALLAGLPQAPTSYNPVLHHAVALARMREVLKLMKQHGYLRHTWQINAAMVEAQRWQFSPPQVSMRYPAFVRYVINQIDSMPRIRRQLYAGIDIYTTIDPQLQDMAQQTVTNQINGLTAQHVTDGALVSLDLQQPHYGWILAMVGSANYHATAGQINMSISPRQPGSSIKPFNYIYAFQHGASPGTTVNDTPILLPDPDNTQTHGWYDPIDYDRQFHGTVTLRQALANSLNVPAVKVEYYITQPNNVAKTAHRFGMKSIYKDNPGLDCNVCYSVTLGGLAQGTRLLEETSAYGVFASGGDTVPPIAIWKVVKRSTGRIIFCSSDCPPGVKPSAWITQQRQRVLDPAHAYEMTDVLGDNSARCTPQVCEFGTNSPLLLSRPSAAKTGTTNAFTDNWTVGYTPQIVTGVWVGNADRTPMRNVIGITGAAPIWNTFMENAFNIMRLPVEGFTVPPGVLQSDRCLVTQPSFPATTAPTAIPSGGTYNGANSPATYTSTGAYDIYIKGDPIPLCRIPERGLMPVTCNAYPQPLPLGWECPSGAYTYNSSGLAVPYYYTSPPNNGYPSSSTGYPSAGYPAQPGTSPP